MKIYCTVCVVNRLLPNLPANLRKKPSKSTLALCKHPKNDEFSLILFSGQNKNGTKYPVNGNIKNVLTKFVNEGKCTIQLKKPEHDLCIQGEAIQLKGFLHLFKRVLQGQVSPKELTLSSMSVTPVKAKDIAPKKLTITQRSNYPSKGFPRTLEALYINDINYCRFDSGILHLNKLKVLNLSNNRIESLPEELGNLPSLKELDVSHNLLGKGTLKQWSWINGFLLKNLVLLDLRSNELKFVPDQIIKLQSLVTLHLSDNSLKSLPVGIGSLRNLKSFYASNNLLSKLPGSIKKLKLQDINVTDNNFERCLHNSAGIDQAPLPVCTLKEYAAKKVLWTRQQYPKGSIPLTLIDYLDYAKYCVCGKACFTVFLRQSHNFRLIRISEVVHTNPDSPFCVPVDCYFCSTTCYTSVLSNQVRRPIVR
ncbi:leucine-rich repeat protein 1 [Sitophilus oryzae]|uniref:Leucine-rich repeat protein 1 n=1 Tax=Sitophilus oryzae TaxID=7048 RepID=A0A6J2XQR4_SITOR|nr:leucine-rich repeat protein 1 [Sitophilus oryzae]